MEGIAVALPPGLRDHADEGGVARLRRRERTEVVLAREEPGYYAATLSSGIRCELTVGLRRIPWQDVLTFTLHEGESAILAQRAMDEVVQLNLLEAGDCPVCAAATG